MRFCWFFKIGGISAKIKVNFAFAFDLHYLCTLFINSNRIWLYNVV